jgi:hypothetical protein
MTSITTPKVVLVDTVANRDGSTELRNIDVIEFASGSVLIADVVNMVQGGSGNGSGGSSSNAGLLTCAGLKGSLLWRHATRTAVEDVPTVTTTTKPTDIAPPGCSADGGILMCGADCTRLCPAGQSCTAVMEYCQGDGTCGMDSVPKCNAPTSAAAIAHPAAVQWLGLTALIAIAARGIP